MESIPTQTFYCVDPHTAQHFLDLQAPASDHVDHVRTQLPYALLAAIVGILVGDIPSAYGLSPWISLLVGVTVMIGVLFTLGKKVESE